MASKPGSKYTDEDIERGLRALVLADGSFSKAHERLAANGMAATEQTLRNWANVHAERYEQLQDSRNDWTGELMASQSEFLAGGYGEAEAKILETILSMPEDELRKLSPNVLATAARNLSISRGVSIDKANELRQRPTRPTGESMSFAEAAKALRGNARLMNALMSPQVIESSAEEIKDDA